MTSTTRYEDDVVAWAAEQAKLLRERRFDLLDIAHLAEEIEDVGRSEQRELASRTTVLLVHLLRWQLQPGRRGASSQVTIRNQRRGIARRLGETPSLRPKLDDPDWWAGIWEDAIAQAAEETGLSEFPEACPGIRRMSWVRSGCPSSGWRPGLPGASAAPSHGTCAQ